MGGRCPTLKPAFQLAEYQVSVLSVPKPPWFGEDVELLSETARRFFERECVPHYDDWEERGSVGTDIWRKAGAAGLLGPSVPEAYGGPGGNFAHDAAIAAEV